MLQEGNSRDDNRGSTASKSASQRTLGRIPMIQKNKDNALPDEEFLSHNRQWRAGDKENSSRGNPNPDASTLPRSSSSSSASSSSASYSSLSAGLQISSGDTPDGRTSTSLSQYNKKPGQQDNVCLDITSYRFIPDDDVRMDILLRKMRGDKEGKVTDGCISTQVLHQLPTVYSN